MSLLFLHIPHTCGRLLNRIFINKIKNYHRIHNEKDYTDKLYQYIYVILRNPIDRCIAEYYHYSNRFKNQKIQVNNMNLSMTSYNSLCSYYTNECTNNLVCKYILQKPLNEKITLNDYELIIKKKIIFDIYTADLKLVNLDNILPDISNELKNEKYGKYLKNEKNINVTDNDIKILKEKNIFDIMLYEYYINK